MNLHDSSFADPSLPDFQFFSGKHVLLALSGGADSVALLDMLVRARNSGLLTLSAAHYCHGIRGASADLDADFCRRICNAQTVAYYQGQGDVPAQAAIHGEGLETAARRMRYGFLLETKEKIGADVIALAHHRDDQAETVLMHLLRGAGLSGMQGMSRLSGCLARPLLSMSKEEILRYLQSRGLSWREDSTNAVADNPRNILRLQAMPALKAAYPGSVEAICRHAEIVRTENTFWESLIGDFLKKHRRRYSFGDYLALTGTEETAFLRRLMVHMLGSDASWERVDRLVALVKKQRGALDITRSLRAERTAGGLYLLRNCPRNDPSPPLCVPGETPLPGLGKFVARLVPVSPIADDPYRQALSRKALQGAVARTRRAGDRIHPLGMEGSKSLSDYMTDRKLDRPLRDHTPLLAVGNEILWAVGLGISRYAALQKGDIPVELTFVQEEFPC